MYSLVTKAKAIRRHTFHMTWCYWSWGNSCNKQCIPIALVITGTVMSYSWKFPRKLHLLCICRNGSIPEKQVLCGHDIDMRHWYWRMHLILSLFLREGFKLSPPFQNRKIMSKPSTCPSFLHNNRQRHDICKRRSSHIMCFSAWMI